jgi:hypothetical protein
MNNSLTNQFNNVLSQYQETYQKYLTSLNDINSNTNLISLENNALFGGNTLNKSKLDNINSCVTSCTSDASCNGANFNTLNSICSLIQNAESIIPANDTTSFVNPALYYSYQLQQLNKQLTDINQQIIILVNQQDSSNNSDKIAQQKKIVTKNYNILNEERDKITQMTNELNTLNSANTNSSLTVSMYYYRYIIFIFIVGLLGFMLINFSSSQQIGGGNNFKRDSIFLLIIILFCLGVSQK